MTTQLQTAQNASLKKLFENVNVRQRFIDALGENAGAYMSTVISVVNSNNLLQQCNLNSILTAAITAANLKLSVNPSLGQAYIVPFGKTATFQIGYRGWIALALRTGNVRRLHSGAIREGQVLGVDAFTGELIKGDKLSDKIVGYIAHIELVNGFTHDEYMTIEQIKAHAEKFSAMYQADLRYGKKRSLWSTNFEAMAQKTVMLRLLTRYGATTLEMQNAIATQQPADNPFADFDNNEVLQQSISENEFAIDEPLDMPNDDAQPSFENQLLEFDVN